MRRFHFLLVRLGAELFAILGIDILKEWVKTDFFFWTFFPALFGAGLALPAWRFRNLALMALRLPGAFGAVLALTFAAALIVAGPAPLWERNIAAPSAFNFHRIAFNFHFRRFRREAKKRRNDSGEKTNGDSAVASGKVDARSLCRFHFWFCRFFPAWRFGAIWIRIGQYGLHAAARFGRAWRGCFCFASSVGVRVMRLAFLNRQDATLPEGGSEWLSGLRLANPILALFAVGILYFSHTPILDPWRLSSQSQILRASDSELRLARHWTWARLYDFGGYGLSGDSGFGGRACAAREASARRICLRKPTPCELARRSRGSWTCTCHPAAGRNRAGLRRGKRNGDRNHPRDNA